MQLARPGIRFDVVASSRAVRAILSASSVMSELGLAQSEIAFRQHFQFKRTVTSGTVPINHWRVCLRRKHEGGSGGRFWKMALKTDFGILYYEDRRPLYCAVESRRTTATFGLFLGLLENRC
jgi:hypothetical protein